MVVPCLDGIDRPYRDLDCAASTPAMRVVADRVTEFLPWYSSVHRGAGYKSRKATAAYEGARESTHRFAGRPSGGGDVVVLCRNTTEAINQLAYRLQLEPDDVVATTVVEHHANLLPWARVAQRRWVECGPDGTFTTEDVTAVLDAGRRPALLALSGASNVTGWLPPVEQICAEAHDRGVPVLLDAAQLAPHRRLPPGPDFVAFSGHKLYAPDGAGALIRPRHVFDTGDPFLAGGGAVDLVDLDEVIWTDPPEREEAGSPNVIGAVAFGAAMDELDRIGWETIGRHEGALSVQLHEGLRAIDGVHVLGPAPDVATLAVAAFTVEGMHHGLVAARLSAEFGIGVRHGCFCAHPYLLRLLGVDPAGVAARLGMPSCAVTAAEYRAPCGPAAGWARRATTSTPCCPPLRTVAAGDPPPVPYVQDDVTGDFWPVGPGPRLGRRRSPGRGGLRPWLTAMGRRAAGATLVGLVLMALLVLPMGEAPSGAAPRPSAHTAWVATEASVTEPGRSVTLVDLTSGRIEAKVSVGSLPSAMVFTGDGRDLLVVSQGNDMLHEIDLATRRVVRSVTVGVEPDAVTVAPGGTTGAGVALVANQGDDTVTPVDLGTWKVGRAIPVGLQPVAIAVASGTAFVADFGSNQVTPIDLATRQAGGAHRRRPRPRDGGRGR